MLPKNFYKTFIDYQLEEAFKNNWFIELDRPIIPKEAEKDAIAYLKSKFPEMSVKDIADNIKEYIV